MRRSGEGVQGELVFLLCSPALPQMRFPAPHSLGAANRAAAEIACRLHLPPAAAARNSHDTLQLSGLKVS